MISRKPRRAILPHTITLWCWTGKERVRNGAKKKTYNKYYVKYCRYDETNALAGTVNLGNLYFEIYNGVSVVTNALNGAVCEHAAPDVYLTASADRQKELFTLNMGDDFAGLGMIEGGFADNGDISAGGERRRKDYLINTVDAKYGAGGVIHHWEVYCK